jgi:protein-tyrosine phosphatase
MSQGLRSVARVLLRAEHRQDLRHEWQRRLRGEPLLPAGPIERILVVCSGNICRSPFAAAWLARSLPGAQLRSAGIRAADGDGPETTACALAQRFGLDLRGHRTRALRADDLAWAQLVLAMEGRHVAPITRCDPRARPRTRLLGHYLDRPPYGIQDPWGRGEESFAATFRRIQSAAEQLARRIEARSASGRGAA